MKHNLLEIFDEEVKPRLFEELKRESPSIDKVIYQHLTIIHASILGGLIDKVLQPNGAKVIKNLLVKGNHTGAIIDRISEIFGSEQQLSDIKKLGNSLLAFVFDEGTDKAFEKIQYFLSEKYLTTEEDLIEVNRMIIPFSIGVIGKIIHIEEMDEQEITDLLIENVPYISLRFPGLAKVMGIMNGPPVHADEKISALDVPPDDTDIPEVISKDITTSPSEKMTPDQGAENDERNLFLKSLWPWVALLVLSGLSLFLLKIYQTNTTMTKDQQDNPFNFIQNDSLFVGLHKSYTLPGNILLDVERNSTLDTLLQQLENNNGPVDTLRFVSSEIRFKDSTDILTSSANKELTNILAILQSYPQLRMDINMYYDENYILSHPELVQKQVKNLGEYFTVFGLKSTRLKINKFDQSLNISTDSTATDSSNNIIKENPAIEPRLKKIELLFYRPLPAEKDSAIIQE